MKLSTCIYILFFFGIIASCKERVNLQRTPGGMPYQLVRADGGKEIQPGHYVKAHFTRRIGDSVLMDTYGKLPMYFQLDTAVVPYDISEVLANMNVGDSLYAKQLMDTFIKQNPMITEQTSFKKGDEIITTVKIVESFSSMQAAQEDETRERAALQQREEQEVLAYLQKNNINAQRVGSGTFVQILEPGTGTQIDAGKYVSVMYRGSTLNGTVFDTNMDASFNHTDPLVFQIGSGGAIKGFEEGLQALRGGSKARIFIPSLLAYGPQAPSPSIGAYEHLIFDVEIVNVSTTAPAQAPAAAH